MREDNAERITAWVSVEDEIIVVTAIRNMNYFNFTNSIRAVTQIIYLAEVN